MYHTNFQNFGSSNAAFICISSIAFCADKFQPWGLINRQNNVFSLDKFKLFLPVSDRGSLLRIARVRENIENSESQVAEKGWSPNLEIRLIANTLPSENPDVRKCYTIPVILVGFPCQHHTTSVS